MEVPYLCMHSLQGVSSFTEDKYYDMEENLRDNKTENDWNRSQFLFIYGFIAVLAFFIMLSLLAAIYYHLKVFCERCRRYGEEESSSSNSRLEEPLNSSTCLNTSVCEEDTVPDEGVSRGSAFDTSTTYTHSNLTRIQSSEINYSTESAFTTYTHSNLSRIQSSEINCSTESAFDTSTTYTHSNLSRIQSSEINYSTESAFDTSTTMTSYTHSNLSIITCSEINYSTESVNESEFSSSAASEYASSS